ncbi:MAG: CBU_0592 family membrane protein [Flavisolibacter sp.]
MSTSDWIGTISVAITLVAYFCMGVRWMSADSRIFFLLNTVGAILTCFASYLISYWPFVALEGFFLCNQRLARLVPLFR